MSETKKNILIVVVLSAVLVGVIAAALLLDRRSVVDPKLSNIPDANWVTDVIHLNGDPQTPYTKRRGESFVKNFAEGDDEELWYRGNFAMKAAFQKSAWLSEHIKFDGEKVTLEIDRDSVSPDHPYSGAEYQYTPFTNFGRYEVVMTAAKGSGIVSSFFSYTGGIWNDPSHEIDIEFLGDDMHKVEFNYFYDGVPHGAIIVPLEYDASEEAHLYAYEWSPDSLKWYVDDKLVHTSTAKDHPIPQYPGRVYLSVWSGSEAQYGWHGVPTFEDGAKATYYCASFQAPGDTSPQCSDTWLDKIQSR